uniref:Uncharacterized protein n=1 Tax=Buteo japonicus TaxID=224669 RepID=A0A8C0AR70_9AVES
PAGQGRFCRQGCLPASWDPPLGTWEQRPSEGAHQGVKSHWESILVRCHLHHARPTVGPAGQAPCIFQVSCWSSHRPAEHPWPAAPPPLRCSGRAGCPGDPGLSPQAPHLLQDVHNNSVLNDNVLGAFLRSGHVAGLSRPVEIQFWHDMVLVSRTPLPARAGGGSSTPAFPLELGKVSPFALGPKGFWGPWGAEKVPSSPPLSLFHQDASNATCVFWQPGASKCGRGQGRGNASSVPP